MNKRDALLSLIHDAAPPAYTPAAFFLHFDPAYHQGQPAVDRHLEFFRYTGMDFVKVQYEARLAAAEPLRRPQDWARAPRCSPEFYEAPAGVAAGLVQAAAGEALVIMTMYSPFMWAGQAGDFDAALREDPEAANKGLEIMTENVLGLVRACKQAGVDGFYASTQGGEAFRFAGTGLFEKYIKPSDLAVWDEIKGCAFNVLHVCDYDGGYDDYAPFLDYPGDVVNSSLKLGGRMLSPRELSRMFGRPFMGGLERKGELATGSPEEIQQAAGRALAAAPERFILAADCTVPGNTPWSNLKTAIDAAHHQGRR
jgi:uroporphyrinogen decarboxylase